MSITTHYIMLTERNFQQEVLAAKMPVLVDCWASWCGAYEAISPNISELAIEVAGRAKVGRLNIATAKELARQYGVRAVPTLLFFKDGQMLERFIGGASKQILADKLNTLLMVDYSNRRHITCL